MKTIKQYSRAETCDIDGRSERWEIGGELRDAI